MTRLTQQHEDQTSVGEMAESTDRHRPREAGQTSDFGGADPQHRGQDGEAAAHRQCEADQDKRCHRQNSGPNTERAQADGGI